MKSHYLLLNSETDDDEATFSNLPLLKLGQGYRAQSPTDTPHQGLELDA